VAPAAPQEPQPPPAETPQFTLSQLQTLFDLLDRINANRNLKYWIIAAGVGAIVETVHVLWLAILWLGGRMFK